MNPSKIVRFGSISLGLSVGSLVAAEPKSHVLFMGADLAIEHNSKLQPVTDIVGDNLIVNVGGKRVEVRQSKEKTLKINESLKITESRVTVRGLKVERAYTPENDPFYKFANAASASAGQAAAQNLAEARYAIAARSTIVGDTDPGVKAQLDALQGAAVAESYQTDHSQLANVAAYAGRYGADQMQEMFDALRGYFEITPERNMARPFYVLIAQFREKGSKPNTARKSVFTKSLDALEAGVTRKVYLLQGGFPPGYELEGHSLHLYNEGEELATDVSSKRVEITAEEALQYRIVEYVGANKGKTLPAALIVASVSGPLRNRLRALVDSGVYVRVTKDGKVGGGFQDAAGKQPLPDAEAQAALKTLRFTPALQDGRPVEQTALLKWSGSSS